MKLYRLWLTRHKTRAIDHDFNLKKKKEKFYCIRARATRGLCSSAYSKCSVNYVQRRPQCTCSFSFLSSSIVNLSTQSQFLSQLSFLKFCRLVSKSEKAVEYTERTWDDYYRTFSVVHGRCKVCLVPFRKNTLTWHREQSSSIWFAFVQQSAQICLPLKFDSTESYPRLNEMKG